MIVRQHTTSPGSRTAATKQLYRPALARRYVLGMLLTVMTFASGCGYMVGAPFSPNIRSVHVPIFGNDTFRRGVEYQLTEAVQDEIKQRTHFRIESEARADTILRGEIVEIRKNVLGETRFDDVRENQLTIGIRVTWEDARTGRMLGQQRIPIGIDNQPIEATGDFAPEVGQSLATATQTAVTRAATQIVDMLEMPW